MKEVYSRCSASAIAGCAAAAALTPPAPVVVGEHALSRLVAAAAAQLSSAPASVSEGQVRTRWRPARAPPRRVGRRACVCRVVGAGRLVGALRLPLLVLRLLARDASCMGDVIRAANTTPSFLFFHFYHKELSIPVEFRHLCERETHAILLLFFVCPTHFLLHNASPPYTPPPTPPAKLNVCTNNEEF